MLKLVVKPILSRLNILSYSEWWYCSI